LAAVLWSLPPPAARCLRPLLTPLFLPLFFECPGDHPDLHSFPTRRSSDLPGLFEARGRVLQPVHGLERGGAVQHRALERRAEHRSEEHTSELQSRENLVCRLLLEKKKRRARAKTHHSGLPNPARSPAVAGD